MLRRRLYYAIKPLVPWSVRVAIRRWFALRKRRHVSGVWPILPGSQKPPEGWAGWPQGKQFAFVLTHDVEGQSGVEKCRQLMSLEDKFGFRSSFNFIPEGEYRVSRELRDELTSNGFEVGVHDLHHDGKLYRSRSTFAKKAVRINQYLKEWGATGFRSGFMLHNLDWLGDLEVLYDASTFDTDAFEPQPDGVGTIFPFWVKRQGPSARSGGYIEMPYTLPQDSTLFLVLEERHPDVWFQKLDWVARHGGMALLNLHPDYVCFDGSSPNRNEFPSAHYIDLLQYVQSRYGGAFWHALPKTVAETFLNTIRPDGDSITAPAEKLARTQKNSLATNLHPNQNRTPYDKCV